MNSTKRPNRRALGSRAEMLKTLKLAYKHVLDTSAFFTCGNTGNEVHLRLPLKGRLTIRQSRDLGRRLATYWDMKP